MGGDHLGKSIDSGYNHLLLSETDYLSYLSGLGEYTHDESDGRTWIYNSLFSYLRPYDYLDLFKRFGFTIRYSSVTIEPRSFSFRSRNNVIFSSLLSNHSFLDLTCTGMTVILQKH